MLFNSSIFLLLSNAIKSRRDKSILYSRVTITLLLISVFTPLWLEWSMLHFCILVLLTLGAIISLLLIYNSPDRTLYYNSEMLAIFTGYYVSLIEKTTAHSVFNDTFLSINIIIGLSMIIIGLLNKETVSVKDQVIFIMNNKKATFIFILVMFLIIFTTNILLFLLGLGITVDTSSFTLFLYTFFAKVISIKLILIFVFCSITKQFKLNSVSLSLSSVIFMVLLGSFNYYYVMPYVKVLMSLGLTKLDNLVTGICVSVKDSSFKADNSQNLSEGIYNIITKFPIIGRYLESFNTNTNNYNNISSPFRRSYHNPFKYKVNVYPLAAISRFNNKFMFTIVGNKSSALYLYETTVDNLELQLKSSYRDYTIALISDFPFTSDFPFIYSNFTCKVKLISSDQMVQIYSTFKNNSLELFYSERTNIEKLDYKSPNLYKGNSDIVNLSSYKKSNTSFFANSYDSLDFIRNYNISPPNQKNDLQVFMQRDFSNYNDNFQIGESSTGPGEPSNLNKGITDKREIYSSIEISMIKLDNKDTLFLNFDPDKLSIDGEDLKSAELSTEGENYLDEICHTARTVMSDYLFSSKSKAEIRMLIDNVKLKDISISADIDKGYEVLFNAFYAKHRDIILLNNIKLADINLFSKIYVDGSADYPDSGDTYDSDDSDIYDSDDGNTDYTADAGLDGFIEQDLILLTKHLKNRMHDLFIERRSNGDWSTFCMIKDLGLFMNKRTLVESKDIYMRSEFTKLLDKLAVRNPELFLKNHNGPNLSITRTTLLPLYSNLAKLIRKTITKEDINFIIHELETRRNRGNLFKDLFFTAKGFIAEKDTNLDAYKLTQLLENLLEQKPQFFLKNNWSKTSVYDLLKDLQRYVDNWT